MRHELKLSRTPSPVLGALSGPLDCPIDDRRRLPRSKSGARRKPESFPRHRALRRKPSWVPLDDEHLKYLWAAYRRGAFDTVIWLAKDLKQEAFREAIIALAELHLERGGEVYAFVGPTEFGPIPVGLVILKVSDDKVYAEPHVIWFPEASARNRLELALAFLVDLKRRFKLLLWVRASDWKLFNHLRKYGVIRTVGKYRGFLPDGQDAYLFQGVMA